MSSPPEIKKVLCFSRSYLSAFLPKLATVAPGYEALHIVQNSAEQRNVEATGQRVVCNLETLAREALAAADPPRWEEPEDIRPATDFPWSPIYADRHIPLFSGDRPWIIAGAIQRAFEQIFDDHDIAGVLTEPVALFPTHYLLYLCKTRGAAPLLWANTYFPGHFYFSHEVHLMHPQRRDTLSGEARDAALAAMRQYLERVAADKAGPVYHHKFAARKQGVRNYFQQRRGEDALILTPGIGMIAIQAARTMRAGVQSALFPKWGDYMTAAAYPEHKAYMRNLIYGRRGYYDAPAQEYNADNIFFPLQYEPEATLLYHAPAFRNQASLIETMAQMAPANKVLWVKEHPNQFGALANGPWPEMRKRYRNLRYVYGRENGRHLIQRCGLGVVLTSTAGMDALLLGRRCVVIGNVFYRDFPGAIPVDDIAGLSAAMSDPVNYGDIDGPEIVPQLAEAMMPFTERCYPGDPQPATGLYEPGNMAHLHAAIMAEIA